MAKAEGLTWTIEDADHMTQAEIYGEVLTQIALKNDKIVALWRQCKQALHLLAQGTGYMTLGAHNNIEVYADVQAIKLPSGRCLYYRGMRAVQDEYRANSRRVELADWLDRPTGGTMQVNGRVMRLKVMV